MTNIETQPAAQSVAPKRVRRRTNWARLWVHLGAMSSGGFLLSTLAVFIGAYHYQAIPTSAIVIIADTVWPFVCLGYLVTQVVPMIVRYQTQGWDVDADQITTIIAVMGTVVVLAGWAFSFLELDVSGWKMFAENVLTHLIDILLMLSGNKMIAAARGSEGTNIR